MEATFDNRSNVLSAQIRTNHDHSVVYKVVTDQTRWRRELTFLKDANPALGDPPVAGVIHWREKVFEVGGVRKSVGEVRRKPKGISFSKERFWRWSNDRKEYTVVYHQEKEWQVQWNNEIVATFQVPYRPKLFGKTKPMVLKMCPTALERDEVFLLLVLIYCEAKRQDRMNASGGWQA
ncbi:hypothetical protein CC2G_008496 [Coprinopsis cinerea AmutBmut pab1-1]|nr:hypothetical protein CC2G_008496 [Coprinopsis cinerea AmutBmut pab1-1]